MRRSWPSSTASSISRQPEGTGRRPRWPTCKTSIEATPGNAITLDTLERDYANIRIQYDQAVANKARAETGDIIEALCKGQRISVIEQAVVPQDAETAQPAADRRRRRRGRRGSWAWRWSSCWNCSTRASGGPSI